MHHVCDICVYICTFTAKFTTIFDKPFPHTVKPQLVNSNQSQWRIDTSKTRHNHYKVKVLTEECSCCCDHRLEVRVPEVTWSSISTGRTALHASSFTSRHTSENAFSWLMHGQWRSTPLGDTAIHAGALSTDISINAIRSTWWGLLHDGSISSVQLTTYTIKQSIYTQLNNKY